MVNYIHVCVCVCVGVCVCVCVCMQESPVEIQIPAHWNFIDRRLSGRLSYRPAILLHHLHVALSFPKEIIRRFT